MTVPALDVLPDLPSLTCHDIDDHPHYGLSVTLGDRHYLAARSNGPGRGWRVEESHQGLTVHIRSTTREHAYAVVMAGLGQDEAVAA